MSTEKATTPASVTPAPVTPVQASPSRWGTPLLPRPATKTGPWGATIKTWPPNANAPWKKAPESSVWGKKKNVK